MSTHLLGFWPFFSFLHHFVTAKLATSSMRVKASGKIYHFTLKTQLHALVISNKMIDRIFGVSTHQLLFLSIGIEIFSGCM